MQVEMVNDSPSWQSDLSGVFTGTLTPVHPGALDTVLSPACKP